MKSAAHGSGSDARRRKAKAENGGRPWACPHCRGAGLAPRRIRRRHRKKCPNRG